MNAIKLVAMHLPRWWLFYLKTF